MKPDPDFDDGFQPKGQKSVRAFLLMGRLLTIVITCGFTFAVAAGTLTLERNTRAFPAAITRALQPLPMNTHIAAAHDRFVVTAALDIDARMVVPAPVGIDEAMVFHPETGQRALDAGAASQGEILTPGPLPDNVNPPRWFAPGQPR